MERILCHIYSLFYCVRSHLREIRDRSVLRLFESNEVAPPQNFPGGAGVPQPLSQPGGHWEQDQVRTVLCSSLGTMLHSIVRSLSFSELL